MWILSNYVDFLNINLKMFKSIYTCTAMINRCLNTINHGLPSPTVHSNGPSTHLPLGKWPPSCRHYFQTHFRDRSFVSWLKFHRRLFLRVKSIITCIGLDNGMVPNRRQAIIWTNGDPIDWRIYAALREDKIMCSSKCHCLWESGTCIDISNR